LPILWPTAGAKMRLSFLKLCWLLSSLLAKKVDLSDVMKKWCKADLKVMIRGEPDLMREYVVMVGMLSLMTKIGKDRCIKCDLP